MLSEAAQEFRDKGYWISRDHHRAGEARSWKPLLKEALAGKTDPSGVHVWMAGDMPEFLRSVMSFMGTASLLRDLCGPQPEFLSVKAVFKDPGVDFASPWHHDWFYWGGSPKISAWIALDDATEENGCLKVIPGSHLMNFPLTEVKSEKGFGNRINEASLKGLPVVSLPARAGDAIFFSDRLVHSSHPNEAKRDRWSLISTYRDGSVPDSSTVWKISWKI